MKHVKSMVLITITIALAMVGCEKQAEEKIELNISAAASLKESMLEIEKQYEKENPTMDLILNFGGSGSLKQQIVQGAPCDIYIPASSSYIEELKAEYYLNENKYKELVKNKLVLISKTKDINDLKQLKNKDIKKIAIGEINSVPAGEYADEVLNNIDIKENIEDKLVYAKDVKEVLAWVKSKNAEAGFVYSTDIINNKNLHVYEIDEKLYSPIIYPIGIMKDSKKIYEATLFENYLLKESTIDIFEEHGYTK